MSSPPYIVGDRPRVTATFRSSAGSLVDPQEVTAQVRAPDGTETTFVYGTDVELVRASVGAFYLDVDLTTGGVWTVRWVGDGTIAGAEELELRVRPSAFATT